MDVDFGSGEIRDLIFARAIVRGTDGTPVVLADDDPLGPDQQVVKRFLRQQHDGGVFQVDADGQTVLVPLEVDGETLFVQENIGGTPVSDADGPVLETFKTISAPTTTPRVYSPSTPLEGGTFPLGQPFLRQRHDGGEFLFDENNEPVLVEILDDGTPVLVQQNIGGVPLVSEDGRPILDGFERRQSSKKRIMIEVLDENGDQLFENEEETIRFRPCL